ncbi:alpha/beta hydrolase family esterase [Streptomyces tsukubensis]|uniref:Phospholipase/carboxylesterase/thioesterase domain-containing protein n=1 Tax=Streptomyces tsukubensis TaxID=83656 RepID=A0A1V4AFH3_9ACTN|nr:PHB depolymerase family esterase [Streptomyces tsukubensis]OON82334.1 hypothetical protein B1H18_04735 [Streptomyces tsukubensis]QFR92830.1 prolyl oligopeptidase family serine peptidase [Streptomyces tsukubensis]
MLSSPSTPRPRNTRRPVRAARTARTRRGALALTATLAAVLTGCGTSTDHPAAPTTSARADGGASGAAPSAGGTSAPADTREHLRVDGVTRSYLLHRPASAGAGPKPLVIAFHGRDDTPAEMRERSGLDKAAKARGMLIAYPEGLRHAWGAGTERTPQRQDPDTDVRYTEKLVDTLVRERGADPERVYAVGFSNGGSMALRVAAQRPGLLAGAVSVSGQLPTGAALVKPTGPVPVMIVYGAEDPVRPLAGLAKPGKAPAGEEPITPTMSSRASARAFAVVNKAGGRAEAPVDRPASGYDRQVWSPGPSGAGVQLLVAKGAGHTWPGSHVTPPKGFGSTSTSLHATDTLLRFLAEQRRPTAAAGDRDE